MGEWLVGPACTRSRLTDRVPIGGGLSRSHFLWTGLRPLRSKARLMRTIRRNRAWHSPQGRQRHRHLRQRPVGAANCSALAAAGCASRHAAVPTLADTPIARDGVAASRSAFASFPSGARVRGRHPASWQRAAFPPVWLPSQTKAGASRLARRCGGRGRVGAGARGAAARE